MFLTKRSSAIVTTAVAFALGGLSLVSLQPHTFAMRCLVPVNVALMVLDYATLHDALRAASRQLYAIGLFVSSSVSFAGALYALSKPRSCRDIALGTFAALSPVVPFWYLADGKLAKGMLLLIALLLSGVAILSASTAVACDPLASLPVPDVHDHFLVTVGLHYFFVYFSLVFIVANRFPGCRLWAHGLLVKYLPRWVLELLHLHKRAE